MGDETVVHGDIDLPELQPLKSFRDAFQNDRRIHLSGTSRLVTLQPRAASFSGNGGN
jgi:hypothetical protein